MAIKVKIEVPIYDGLIEANARMPLKDPIVVEDLDSSERFIRLTVQGTTVVVLAQDLKAAVENAINNARFA